MGVKSTPQVDKGGGLVRKMSLFIATYLNIGYFPVFPGTVASFFTLPIVWFLLFTGNTRGLFLGTVVIALIALVSVKFALVYCSECDPGFIVIDEVLGQLITFIPSALLLNLFISDLIFSSYIWSFIYYFAGFVLFRLFDIIKPHYIGVIDEFIDGAAGVILDDVVAGIYAGVSLIFICLLFYFINYFAGASASVVG